MKILLSFVGVALVLVAPLSAATLVVNPNSAGGASERGFAFDLTNNSATEAVQFSGTFRLPVITSASEGFQLWIRTGTVVGNIGADATEWTNYGTITQTGNAYASPTFALTTYTFDLSALPSLAPGQTYGFWIKDSNTSISLRYAGAGSPAGNSVTTTAGFSDGGSLTIANGVGLTATGNAPNVTNSLSGTPRNFIGEIDYTVVPEPGTAFLIMAGAGMLLLGTVRQRLA